MYFNFRLFGRQGALFQLLPRDKTGRQVGVASPSIGAWRPHLAALLLPIFAALSSLQLAACGDAAPSAGAGQLAGQVEISVALSAAEPFTDLVCRVTGEGMTMQELVMGRKDSQAKAYFDFVPVGPARTFTVTARRQALPACVGSVTLPVIAGQPTKVAIVLNCTMPDPNMGEVSVQVQINHPPQISQFNRSLRVAYPKQPVYLTGLARDVDPGDEASLQYVWHTDGGKLEVNREDPQEGTQATWQASRLGHFTVTLTVTDRHGGVAQHAAQIQVVSREKQNSKQAAVVTKEVVESQPLSFPSTTAQEPATNGTHR